MPRRNAKGRFVKGAGSGRKRSTPQRKTGNRRRTLRGSGLGLAKFLPRNVSQAITNGAIGAIGAHATGWLTDLIGGQLKKEDGTLLMADKPQLKSLMEIAVGAAIAVGIDRALKRRDVAAAWLTGVIVYNGASLLASMLPTAATAAGVGRLVPGNQIPMPVAENIAAVHPAAGMAGLGRMYDAGANVELSPRAA